MAFALLMLQETDLGLKPFSTLDAVESTPTWQIFFCFGGFMLSQMFWWPQICMNLIQVPARFRHYIHSWFTGGMAVCSPCPALAFDPSNRSHRSCNSPQIFTVNSISSKEKLSIVLHLDDSINFCYILDLALIHKFLICVRLFFPGIGTVKQGLDWLRLYLWPSNLQNQYLKPIGRWRSRTNSSNKAKISKGALSCALRMTAIFG